MVVREIIFDFHNTSQRRSLVISTYLSIKVRDKMDKFIMLYMVYLEMTICFFVASSCDIKSGNDEELTYSQAEHLCYQQNMILAMPKPGSDVYNCSLTTTR